jgi:DNA segregation ATPase FtsK/SpoIIIE, S-DNA-T family
MFAEILTTALASGMMGVIHYKKGTVGDDHKKIQLIAKNCGLVSKDGKEIRIHRKGGDKKNKKWKEYVYQMPHGLSYKQFNDKINNFQDGLNIKKTVLDISLQDIRKIRISKDIVNQVRELLKKKQDLRKEVEISFDGMLRFKVYNEQLTKDYTFKEAMRNKYFNWQIPIGLDRTGKLIKHDFESIPHMALGGATRYGKSNFLNSLIVSLIQNHPDDVKFTLIDLKGGVELCDYEKAKQTVNIAYEPEEALEVLQGAYDDMLKMQRRLRQLGKKKVQDTSIKERHFIIIDEVGELNPDEAVTKEEKRLKQDCQIIMSKIARLGAGLGFRQILATQYGTGDVIPRQCKQNSDAKLCFRVRNATASTVVLDEEGAEKLPLIKGRAIYQTDQRFIVQTPLIESEDIEYVIKINLRSRKDEIHEKGIKPAPKGREHTIIFEETALS